MARAGRKSSNVTMNDVAREAAVSKASVSRALSGRSGAVSEGTANKVREAVARIGYIPNAVAASLASRSTKIVGFVLPDLGNPFFALVAAGIETTIQRGGYRLLVANTDGAPDREVALTQLFLEHRVDALLVATSAVSGEHLERAIERGVHVAFVDSRIATMELDCVLADNSGGGHAAAQHLIDLGHTDIGLISGLPADSASTDRIESAAAAIEAASGHEFPHERVALGKSTVQSGYDATHSLLTAHDPPSALFVANNLMTVGAMRAAADLGVHIPDDLSLVGFDDMDWYPMANPAITTVAQPAHEIGVQAAKRVLKQLRARRPLAATTIILPTELILRASTAPRAPAVRSFAAAVGRR